ncbi:CCL2 protein, partial [Sitta europaea]|nr:CCL2 protein [Sitta europaea]
GSARSASTRKFSCVNLPTKQVNTRTLVSYGKQRIPTDAIMFITAGGKRICASAGQRWVQTAIKKIDERRAAK